MLQLERLKHRNRVDMAGILASKSWCCLTYLHFWKSQLHMKICLLFVSKMDYLLCSPVLCCYSTCRGWYGHAVLKQEGGIETWRALRTRLPLYLLIIHWVWSTERNRENRFITICFPQDRLFKVLGVTAGSLCSSCLFILNIFIPHLTFFHYNLGM